METLGRWTRLITQRLATSIKASYIPLKSLLSHYLTCKASICCTRSAAHSSGKLRVHWLAEEEVPSPPPLAFGFGQGFLGLRSGFSVSSVAKTSFSNLFPEDRILFSRKSKSLRKATLAAIHDGWHSFANGWMPCRFRFWFTRAQFGSGNAVSNQPICVLPLSIAACSTIMRPLEAKPRKISSWATNAVSQAWAMKYPNSVRSFISPSGTRRSR